MSIIVDRYRERLDDTWPAPMDDLVGEIVGGENRTSTDRAVGHVLDSLVSTEGLEPGIRAKVDVDATAFRLKTQQRDGAWGPTYFGPLWGFGNDESGAPITNPPREAISEEMIGAWRLRHEQLKHACARARFADAAWDLAHLAGIRRDVNDAHAAIDAYLDDQGWPESQHEAAQRLGRAITLARLISDEDRAAKARQSIVAAAKRGPRGAEFQHCLLLALNTLVLTRDKGLSADDENYIIEAFQAEFDRRVEAGDPHGALGWGRHLLALHRKRNDQEALRETARRIGGHFEKFALKGGAMMALALLQKAHAVYREVGLSDDAARVRLGIADAMTRSKSEMASFEVKTEVPTAEVEKYAEEVTDGDLGSARVRFYINLVTTRAQAEQHLAATDEAAPIMRVMNQSVIDGDAQSMVEVPSSDTNREPNLVRAASFIMSFRAITLRRVADRFVSRHELTAESLAQFGEVCGTFPPSRRGIRTRAFEAYLSGDYATACHLLVPQIEHAIRLLLRSTGDPTTTTDDDRTWMQMTLGAVLRKETMVEFLGEDLSFYLRVLLCENLGWNVRDLMCHGLVGDQWFTRDVADRLLHVVVALSIHDMAAPKDDSASADEGSEPTGGEESDEE